MIYLLFYVMVTVTGTFAMAQPQALVYRGPASCDGCPEAVAEILESSPSKFKVTFAGPNEDVDITAKSLSEVDVYVQPGGGGLDSNWRKMKPYSKVIRAFVANGGRYLGFCLGAYLSGTPGFNILPPGANTDEEMSQTGAQVKSGKDTIIQIDWTFSTGALAGQTQKRCVYFQDGAVMKLPNQSDAKILGRYSSNQDIASSITPFGSGWVGVVGPHPEADGSWYDEYDLRNPDGINFDIAYDFVETTFKQKANSTSTGLDNSSSYTAQSGGTTLLKSSKPVFSVAAGLWETMSLFVRL